MINLTLFAIHNYCSKCSENFIKAPFFSYFYPEQCLIALNMHLKSSILFLTMFFHFLFSPFLSKAKTFQDNPLIKAIQLFDKEKFSEAEPLFKKILDQRPDDFMVNYFYGACRTENGHYSEQDLSYLIKASKEVTPLNIDYYFAVQYHAKNQWEKAMVYYKLYKDIASVNEEEKVNLVQKMEQCASRINPFVETESPQTNVKSEDQVVTTTETPLQQTDPSLNQDENLPVSQSVEIDTVKALLNEKIESLTEIREFALNSDTTIQDVIEPDTLASQQPAVNQVIEKIQLIPKDELIEFYISNEITYFKLSNFRTSDGKMYFNEGTARQTELDLVINATEVFRSKYSTSKSWAEKDSIGQQILELESKTYELKKMITQLFSQAKNAESGFWQNASPVEKENFLKELNALAEEGIKKDINTKAIADSQELIVPPVLIDNEKVEKPSTKTKTSDITYKIQIGAYSRGIPNNLKSVFNKISMIRKVENYTDDKGVVVYVTGNLTSYDDAVLMQNQIRQEGIKDPIIAAYLNGKRITLEQAKETEKQK